MPGTSDIVTLFNQNGMRISFRAMARMAFFAFVFQSFLSSFVFEWQSLVMFVEENRICLKLVVLFAEFL